MPDFSEHSWRLSGSSKRGYSQVSDDRGEVVITTHGQGHALHARLCAVAPQLFEELRSLLAGHGHDGGKGFHLPKEHANKVRALLRRVHR